MQKRGTQFICIRGLPGSGKTTLANLICSGAAWDTEHDGNGDDYYEHLEADMYFMRDGVYQWDAALVKEAHAWCLAEFKKNIFKRTVVVSNTFTTQKEVQPYFNFCATGRIPIQVIECKGQFGSIHDVPPVTIARMMQRWENLLIPRI